MRWHGDIQVWLRYIDNEILKQILLERDRTKLSVARRSETAVPWSRAREHSSYAAMSIREAASPMISNVMG